MEERLIQNLKNAWRNCNAATVGFAANVPERMWRIKPFEPRFKLFAWEFACLTRTRLCYLQGLQTGKLNFSDRPGMPNKEALSERSKKELCEDLEQAARDLILAIEKIETTEQVDMIIWLLQHERIHHGKLTLYHSIQGLNIPDSFRKTWGESNFP